MRGVILALVLCLAATQANAQTESLFSQVDVANKTLADTDFLNDVANAIIGSTVTFAYISREFEMDINCPNDFTYRDAARLYATEVLRRARTQPELRNKIYDDANAVGTFAFKATTSFCRAEVR